MISKPDVNISLLSATNILDIGVRRDLVVCQTPGASANALVTGIHNKTKAELDTLFGAGSYSRFLIQQWLTANQTGNNVKAELDTIVLKEGVRASTPTILTVDLDGDTGNYTITVDGETTANIAHTADAAAIEAAVLLATGIPVSVVVGSTIVVTFDDDVHLITLPTVSGDVSGLTGDGTSTAVATPGVSSKAKAAGSLAVTGTATEAGSLVVSILSSKLFKKTITIASGDTHLVVGAAIQTAFAGLVAPFTVVNTSGTVALTASDYGTLGNGYGIEVTGIPAGLAIAVTAFTGGATSPSVTNLFTLIGSRRYTGILWPNDLISDVDVLTTLLDARFNASNEILDGVGFVGYSGTLANSVSLVTALNSQSLVVMGNILTAGNSYKKGPEIVHPLDYSVAEFMGIRERRLSDNASIASVVTTNAFGDQFGGMSLASLPYFNTPLALTPVTTSINLFNYADQATLNEWGFSVYGPNRTGTNAIMGTVVTTYKTDVAGNEDVSFKYLEYVDTASVCREFLFNNLKEAFDQTRLTDGDLVEGRAMENTVSIKATFLRLLAFLKDAALVRKGRVADKLIADNLSVIISLADRNATIYSVLPIVTQLEGINVPLRLTFEI